MYRKRILKHRLNKRYYEFYQKLLMDSNECICDILEHEEKYGMITVRQAKQFWHNLIQRMCRF